MRKRYKNSFAFLLRLTIISLIFQFNEQIARASDNRKDILKEATEINIRGEYNDKEYDFDYEDQIKCNHLHCSDDVDHQKKNITVCPELQNATFIDGKHFNGLGRPQCDVHLEFSFYHPNKMDLNLVNDASTCEISAKYFPNDKKTMECIQRLTEDDSITKVVWIIHGYHADSTAQWLHEMKNNIQVYDNRHGKAAVILVDWGEFYLNIFDLEANYIVQAQDTQYVGYGLAIIANAIKKAFKRDIYFHCIGHSLGAHICGFGGKQLLRLSHNTIKFNRITGLDPAGPIFCKHMEDPPTNPHLGPPKGSQYCIDSKYRLSDKDADIVDVIHTDGISDEIHTFGTMKPLGSVDFYAGESPAFGFEQPGCKEQDQSIIPLACSHTRSHKYFSESIKNSTLFPLTAKCQNGFPLPSECQSTETKTYPKFDLIHTSNPPLPGMGYWLDESTKGIYTIDVTGYCNSLGPQRALGCGNTTFVY